MIEYSAENMPKGKLLLWFKYYLDASNPETYLNNTNSAVAAGYKAKSRECFGSIGAQNFKKLRSLIGIWLNENGMSPEALKIKCLRGIDAKQLIYATFEGKITDEKEVENWAARHNFLRLAMNVQGMLVERKEVSGKDGKPIEHAHTHSVDELAAALMSEVAGQYKHGQLPNQLPQVDRDSVPSFGPVNPVQEDAVASDSDSASDSRED